MRIGRVYKIVHNQSDLVYVGSTFNQLRFRFRDHKARKEVRKCIIAEYFKKYGVENFKIMLIKEYKVVDRQHLRAKEQLWINKLRCINQYNCLRLKNKHLKKQWAEENKENLKQYKKQWKEKNRKHVNEYQKKWRAENKEHYKDYRSQKIYCDVCDVYMNRSSKTKHLKTKKHAKNLTILNSDIIV